MYLGLPIIAYDVDFNRETTNHEALFFKNSKELNRCLKENNDDSLALLGKNMSKIANKKYKWEDITKSYEEFF